jgi:ubiquitin carboxyl-terminal hydrolase 7
LDSAKKNPSNRIPASAIYTETRQYYDYLLNRMNVTFAPTKGEGEEFSLTLSKKMTYDQFSKKVGEHLNVDPTHLRFSPVIASSGKPKPPIKRNVNQTLHQILSGQYGTYGYSMHRADALYYEVLETSLSEYETKKNLKVTWLPEGINKEASRLL